MGIAKSVFIGGNLTVSGTFNGGSVEFGNVKIAQTTANTIDTKSGNLTLDSAGGAININVTSLDVNSNMDVSGNVDLNTDSLSKTTTMSIAKVQSVSYTHLTLPTNREV